MTPSIGAVLRYYPIAAAAERAKTGLPGERTVGNVVCGARQVCRAAGLDLEAPVVHFTRPALDHALAMFLRRGLSRLTAYTYINNVRALFAHWAEPYYADRLWDVPRLEFPAFRALAPRYVQPDGEQLRQVKIWYATLKGEMWLAATLMLEFAMRNGDVLRMTKQNFIEKDGQRYLDYTPHKTALTSGRRVCWPIHPDIWNRINLAGGFDAFDLTDDILHSIGADMRHLGFRGNKSAYELRKICIDHVYQHFGAELASSISGDDIKTVTRYYADPSKPTVGNIRIVDFL